MFYPIALRILDSKCTGAKKLTPNIFYKFIDGVDINDDGDLVSYKDRIEDSVVVGDYNKDLKPNIRVCAIVGENGSGKSTLVDLFLRMVNNFGAAVLGEKPVAWHRPHLHFINGLHCELIYFANKCKVREEGRLCYKLKIVNREVLLYEYSIVDSIDCRQYEIEKIPKFRLSKYYPNTDGPFVALSETDSIHREEALQKMDELRLLFFYTYISNYCADAYNPEDFASEANDAKYEKLCRGHKNSFWAFPDNLWLEGIFHRKEQYQQPFVVHPKRKSGRIDYTLERLLSKDRLFRVLQSENSRFVQINDHLELHSVLFNCPNDARYYNEKVNDLITQPLLDTEWMECRRIILSNWSQNVGKDLAKCVKSRRYGEIAIAYLIYKTIKTFFKDSDVKPQWSKKVGALIASWILDLKHDKSHVTRKIRITLLYLAEGYLDLEEGYEKLLLDTLKTHTSDIINKISLFNGEKENYRYIIGQEELIVPPFLDYSVNLTDTKTSAVFDFNLLSSGEKQLIYSTTAIIDHLLNLDSVHTRKGFKLCYHSINIIFEEVEQFFHPDLQRRLIFFLAKSIQSCNFHHVRDINIMFVTHSPFILSDIPARNILALKKDGTPMDSKEIRSFGANIHDILRHPFFLEHGAVGEFAKDYIKRLSKEIERLGDATKNAEGRKEWVSRLQDKINLIDEPLVKRILRDKLTRLLPSQDERLRMIEAEIKHLEEQRKQLQNRE